MAKTAKPTVFAFEKKLVPSNALMFSANWESKDIDIKPLSIIEKAVRGTISNRFSKKDEKALSSDGSLNLKLANDIKSANLQTVDSCSLDNDKDTLVVKFSLKVLGGLSNPCACNNNNYLAMFKEKLSFKEIKTSFEEVSKRYAYNIASGRFLWRNRVGAEKVVIKVTNIADKNQTWTFNALDYNLNSFEKTDKQLENLSSLIFDVLSSEDKYINLDIVAYSLLGYCQDCYPSEEMFFDKEDKKDKKDKKNKILFSVDDIAGMHSQKIGNALRTIDTWYDSYSDYLMVIPVESYGSVTNYGLALRPPKTKKDFYNILDSVIDKFDSLSQGDLNYFTAMLIRGGVFGDKKDKKDKKEKE